MTQHVVMFSAGSGSWATAKRVVERHGASSLTMVFADTLYEDADAYRFLVEGSANVLGRRLNWGVPSAAQFPDYRVSLDTPIESYSGNPEWRAFLRDLRERAALAMPELVWLVEGRDPWEVYRDERMLGNSRIDPCSKHLKRKVADSWLAEHCDPLNTICYVGIDWTEKHRYDDGEGGGLGPRRAAQGWNYQAPLCDPPWIWRPAILKTMTVQGLLPPRMYALGYAHDNCGGFCCKAGHAHYANRLRVDPGRYAYDEAMEGKMQTFLGRPVSMLTDRRGGGGKKPLSLMALRARLAADPQMEMSLDDHGGCGCMIDVSEAAQ